MGIYPDCGFPFCGYPDCGMPDCVGFGEGGGGTTPVVVSSVVVGTQVGDDLPITITATGATSGDDIYYVVYADGLAAPTAAQVIAGDKADGTDADNAGSDTWPGPFTVSAVTLDAGDYVFAVVINNGVNSNVEVSNSFTVAATATLSVTRVPFVLNKTVPNAPGHANSDFYGIGVDEVDSTHDFTLDLTSAEVGDLLLVAAAGRAAIGSGTLGGASMSVEATLVQGLYRNPTLFSHTIVSGDVSASRAMTLDSIELEFGVTALLVKGGVLQDFAVGSQNNSGFTLDVDVTDTTNLVYALAGGHGAAMTTYDMTNMTVVDDLAYGNYDQSGANIGVAFATAEDVSTGTFSTTFVPEASAGSNADSGGILILVEPA